MPDKKTYESWHDIITVERDTKGVIASYLQSDSLIYNYPHDMARVMQLLTVCSGLELSSFLAHLADATYLNDVAQAPAPYTDIETLCDIKRILLERHDWEGISKYYVSYSGYNKFLDLLEPEHINLVGLYDGGHSTLLHNSLCAHPQKGKQELLRICIGMGDNRVAKQLLVVYPNTYRAFLYAVHYRNKEMIEHIFPREKDFHKLFKTYDYMDIQYVFYALGAEAVMLRFHTKRIFTECMGILQEIGYPLNRDYCANVLDDRGRSDLADILINRIIT